MTELFIILSCFYLKFEECRFYLSKVVGLRMILFERSYLNVSKIVSLKYLNLTKILFE